MGIDRVTAATAILPVSAFVAHAKEPLPDLFLGHLSTYVVAPVDAKPLLRLYLVGDSTIVDFVDESVQVKEDIVGLGFVYIDDRSGSTDPRLQFWFRPSLLAEEVQRRATALVDHAMPNQTASFQLMTPVEVPNPQPKWSVKIYARHTSSNQETDEGKAAATVLSVGSTWLDEASGERLTMDHAIPSDAEAISKSAWSGSSPAYILSLLAHPVFSKLIHVVRVEATQQPVAWCVVHSSFVLGLVFTDPAFRRRGLAKLVTRATIDAFDACVESFDGLFGLQPHCFILDSNTASRAMFDSLGFSPAIDGTNTWLGSA